MTTTPTAPPELPDLDCLEALARAATAGSWLYRRDPGNPIGAQHCVKLAGENGAWVCDCIDNADRNTVGGIAGQRNAAFIAGANPATVLALIALARRAQPEDEAPQANDTLESMAQSNARFAIDGAIQYGRENRNEPPSPEHWLYEYWNIGRQLAQLGATGWDNVTPVPAATLSPLCCAQHAESGAPTQAAYDILLEVCRGAAHALIAARDMVGHPDNVAFIDRALANPGLLAQQAAAPGMLYSYMGESSRYELLGDAVGAGKCRLIDPLTVYRDTATGNLYFRHPSDFAARMVAIKGNALSGQGTPEAPANQDAKDAARYRVLRQHVLPHAVGIRMDRKPPARQPVEERIDLLCDIVIERRAAAQLDGGQKGSESNG